MAKPFPSSALRPRAHSFTPANTLKSGPLSDGGYRQEVLNDAGFWTARYESIYARREQVPVLRAFLAEAVAMRSSYNVGPIDCFHNPLVGEGAAETDILFWESPLGEHTWGGGEHWGSSRTLALTQGSVLAGAMTLVADVDTNYEIKPGQYFGLGTRLYIIRATRLVDLALNHWAIDFWPPLRAAAVHNATIELGNPVCPMRIINAPEALLDLARFATVTLEFEEVLA